MSSICFHYSTAKSTKWKKLPSGYDGFTDSSKPIIPQETFSMNNKSYCFNCSKGKILQQGMILLWCSLKTKLYVAFKTQADLRPKNIKNVSLLYSIKSKRIHVHTANMYQLKSFYITLFQQFVSHSKRLKLIIDLKFIICNRKTAQK